MTPEIHILVRRRGEQAWGILQGFAGGKASVRREQAEKTLRNWQRTWDEAGEFDFRLEDTITPWWRYRRVPGHARSQLQDSRAVLSGMLRVTCAYQHVTKCRHHITYRGRRHRRLAAMPLSRSKGTYT